MRVPKLESCDTLTESDSGILNDNEKVAKNRDKICELKEKKRVKWLDECVQSSSEEHSESDEEDINDKNGNNNCRVFDINRRELPQGSDVFQQTLKDIQEEREMNKRVSGCVVAEEAEKLDKESCKTGKSRTEKLLQRDGAKVVQSHGMMLGYQIRSSGYTYMKSGLVNRSSSLRH
ncbi:hypothetical protein CHS0354_042219 [Potamilus streckersoni]|uniref:Uncharacterized protein n=1 Tax=Potamilus streckersoni TaxID=2493646 RepID=A0AAE0TNT0_9BIVA|nr:hypothetical protein CHS0354_042219 [Potamilus streckersoni]